MGSGKSKALKKTSLAGHKPQISKNMPRGQCGDSFVWSRASEEIQLCTKVMKGLKSKVNDSEYYSIYNEEYEICSTFYAEKKKRSKSVFQ